MLKRIPYTNIPYEDTSFEDFSKYIYKTMGCNTTMYAGVP